MDIRDNAHDQLVTHIATLRYLAAQDTPALIIWQEMQRILTESATHLELFVVPKVEVIKQHLDILGRNEAPNIAVWVPAAGDADAVERIDVDPAGFLGGNGTRK